MKLFIISGRSGSGKSTILQALEDQGYQCIDNLPVTLLHSLVEENLRSASLLLAVCIDARSQSLQTFPEILKALPLDKSARRVVYLDAVSPTLVKRFSETRRRHPLTSDKIDLRQAIDMEAQVLGTIADLADLTIDTTQLSSQQLKAQFVDRVLDHDSSNINLLVRSFGFKYGVPVDADFVFDLRCLPNPHWNPELRTLSGLDQPVMDYLQDQPMVNEMFEDISSILNRWVPRFEDNARVYMTVAIGCTGGQHRSVYMAQRLAEYLSREHSNVLVRHRELNRG
ncbi:MAG: RNase adapter RapZ [Pseudomonadota bacterium]|nr:RNase adapter RapZ [Pseudomonadota bacterium]MEC7553323.1 RNase adapter RapZ [Pseudomonadota bacterium]MEC7956192.1 RNase adapter RapZ [Pseudomonadota bacterium]MEC8059178.1 RNase adapter RapZ [Pseudomonadota bacterium]MEC8349778.1 RNase adapter RapZ [Pseudomonadota bacterium]